ncbi:MAG: hypothetical protein OWR52_10295 [Acidibacillus sp.]|uniref:Uncharacterized protein n=1 Tax=Sulfoacidibacillus ferrooxidans TaxID=2005001 RepID=A0A9X2AB45_9BACL|nr:hypothetical protein [Sulfoacidibacillus ferrooxidans]MCI0182304.1 hypothetical protein [Sulfoacidibacillus ferrooxidans]MCY0893883.1 hypothetical protein [Acidibacillus sp.]
MTSYQFLYASFSGILVGIAFLFLILFVAKPTRRYALVLAIACFIIGTIGMAVNLIH